MQDISQINAIFDRAAMLKEFMKANDRIDKVAQFVAEHFIEMWSQWLQSLSVAVDREACVKYRKALLKDLPAEDVELVYSSNNDDKGDLKTYTHSPVKEREIRRNFIKRDKNPKF